MLAFAFVDALATRLRHVSQFFDRPRKSSRGGRRLSQCPQVEFLEVRALLSGTPQVDVSVQFQAAPLPGDGARFQIIVTNAGPDDAPGTTLVDNFPSYFGNVTWSDGSQSGTGDINQTFDLAAGQSVTFTVSGSLLGSQPIQSLDDTATATVAAGITDPDPANNTDVGFSMPAAELFQLPPVATYEGSTAPVTLAAFTYGQNTLPPSAFDITIDWGDGTTSAADVALGQNGYYVEGSHAYSGEGSHQALLTFNYTTGPITFSSNIKVHEIYLPGGTPDGYFVQEAYHDVFHREVDPAALTYWTDQLSAGLTRQAFAQALLSSTEYLTQEVQEAFQQYLHRAADAGAVSFFVPQLAGGMTPAQLDKVLVTSPEYFQTRSGGTDDGFLDALWADTFGRGIDPQARFYFDNLLSHGGTRAEVADVVFGSLEYAVNTVNGLFDQFLERPNAGDDADFDDLRAGGSANDVIIQLIASSEYYQDATD